MEDTHWHSASGDPDKWEVPSRLEDGREVLGVLSLGQISSEDIASLHRSCHGQELVSMARRRQLKKNSTSKDGPRNYIQPTTKLFP